MPEILPKLNSSPPPPPLDKELLQCSLHTGGGRKKSLAKARSILGSL